MTGKRIKKWLCLIFMVTVMVGIFPIAVKAQQQRVYDRAALLTAEEVQQLEQEITELQSKTNYDLAVVTTDDAEGKTARDYADDFYDTNHFGMGSEESGALLLIDMDNREVWISTAGGMIDILTDARIEMILDAVFEEVVNENYAKAAETFLQKTEVYIEQGVVEGQFRETVEEAEPVDKASAAAGGFAIGLIGGAAISGILCLIIARRYKGRRGEGEYAYQQNAKMNLTRQEDMFLNQTVTQRKIPKNPPPQSSSSGYSSAGRSSVHHSSSGRTHGGGGRKF